MNTPSGSYLNIVDADCGMCELWILLVTGSVMLVVYLVHDHSSFRSFMWSLQCNDRRGDSSLRIMDLYYLWKC